MDLHAWLEQRDRLWICGKPWRLKVVPLVVSDGSHSWGECIHNSHIVRVGTRFENDTAQDGVSMLDSLLHEVLHAMFNEHRLLRAAVGADNEEAVIHELAAVLADFLTRNGLIPLKED